jgi:hypothetical protein
MHSHDEDFAVGLGTIGLALIVLAIILKVVILIGAIATIFAIGIVCAISGWAMFIVKGDANV